MLSNNQIHGKHFNGRKHHHRDRSASARCSGYFVLSNAIIRDKGLKPAAKRLYAVLAAYQGGNNKLTKTMDTLCKLSGITSRTTLCHCLDALIRRGLICKKRRYYYSVALKRMVYGANRYHVVPQDFSEGYTLISRSLLDADLTNTAFAHALEIYALSGRKGRSWLSLRRTAARLGMPLTTICRALHQFRRSQTVSYIHCRKANWAYGCNSYYPVDFVRRGAGKNGQLQVSNKITKEFNKKGESKVSANSAFLPNFEWLSWPDKPWYWEGKAIRVSACDEPDDIAI